MAPDVVIVGDIHGRPDLLEGVLVAAGAARRRGGALERTKGVEVIQLGDLLHVGYDSLTGDRECLAALGRLVDVALIGNHEAAMIGGPTFRGYFLTPGLRDDYLQAIAGGLVVPAAVRRHALITHAGLVPRAFGGRPNPPRADRALDLLLEAWEDRGAGAAVFNAVGQLRGGWSDRGGVLWRDDREPLSGAFPQVYGHTPRHRPTFRLGGRYGHWSARLDVGAGLRGQSVAMRIPADETPIHSELYVFDVSTGGRRWL